MKDRLIELIQQSVKGCARNWAEIIAEYLLANGVIVPPCKVGDTVYLIPTYNGKPCCCVIEDKIQMIGITSRGIHIKARNHHDHNKMYMLGKSAYLAREAAEQALKGGVQNERI